MDPKIIYCFNAYNNKTNVLVNCSWVIEQFNQPNIYIASNELEYHDIPWDEYYYKQRIHFKKWGKNQGWQLGALNSCLQSLKFAAENEKDSVDSVVIFSHDDVHPIHHGKISKWIKYLDTFDIVTREYEGQFKINPGPPYYMIECLLISGRVLKQFLDVPVYQTEDYCAEQMFGRFCVEKEFAVCDIGITKNQDLVVNEMGFFHNHAH